MEVDLRRASFSQMLTGARYSPHNVPRAWSHCVTDTCGANCRCQHCSTTLESGSSAFYHRKLRCRPLYGDDDEQREERDGEVQCGAFLSRRRREVPVGGLHGHRSRGYRSSGIMLLSLRQQTKPLGSVTSIQQAEPLSRSTQSLLDGLEGADLRYGLASTMLQQILETMYIDPELLAELDEEQKQILFCRMREEQVRRWTEQEKKFEKSSKKHKKPKKPGGKQVSFMTGKDGNPWTWVMGAHVNDKTLEQIMEKEELERARKLAEEEAEKLRIQMEEELARKAKEEEENLERERKQKEEELRRKAEEAAQYQTLKEAKLAAKKLEEEKKQKEEEEAKRKLEIRKKREYRRSTSLMEVTNLVSRRCSEIYGTLQKERKESEKRDEEASRKIDRDWKEQEKKAKEIEREQRAIVAWAREEHRRSVVQKMQAVGRVMVVHNKVVQQNKQKPPVPGNKPQLSTSGRPPNKAAIIRWFTEKERPNGAGLNPATEQVAIWFHGLISRPKAEEMLEEKEVGSFLVRVSERIWGYAISYRAPDRCKHFLIDAGEGNYQFFGTNQIPHPNLAHLIEYHQAKPISHSGKELLLHPCGQESDTPDYREFFDGSEVKVSSL